MPKQERYDYNVHVGTVISKWRIEGVLVSRAETNTPVYFEAVCLGCEREFQPPARGVVTKHNKACEDCTAIERRGRAAAPGRAHKPKAMIIGGKSVTMCGRCFMQPGWAGWDNPCGKPVTTRANRQGTEAA